MISKNTTNDTPQKDLVKDEQGAVMIMGLAMILGLIAFLWYLIGIGSTLAFRDHMQESADSAAFSQPAVEALCMNIIVFINLIMMVMIAIYMAWSVVVTISWMGSVLCCPSIILSIECCPRIPFYIEDWNSRNTAAKYMAELDGILSPLESIIAIAAPWAGTGVAYLSSSSYQQKQMQSAPIGFAMSEMNIPGTLDLGSTTGRFGLPVTHDYLGNDCSHLFDILFQSIGSLLGPVSKALNKVGGVVAGIVQYYWCDNEVIPGSMKNAAKSYGHAAGNQPGQTTDANGNTVSTNVPVDQFPPPTDNAAASANKGCNTSNGWSTTGGILRVIIGGGDGGNYWNCGSYGPMMNYKHPIAHPPATGHDAEYKNDADMMQSFAATFIPNAYDDKDASRIIQFMQLQHMVGFHGTNTPPSSYGYYAQGELYFDCDGGWTDSTCDDIQTGANGGTDMTMYRFQWRARLVKIHFPGGLGKFINFLNGILGYVSDVRSYINSNGNSMSGIIGLVNKFDPSLVSTIVNAIGAIADPIPGTLAH